MEVKINREIRDYQESVFFGLSMRQLCYSALAIGVAVGIYFGLRNVLGAETVAWLCILGAAPFEALGFVKYNGMTAGQFILAYIRSEFLMPRQLCFRSENIYYAACGEYIENRSITPSKEKKQRKGEKKNDN